MQPYLFPYLGYFQLIHAADRFVLLDDVGFIKQGWINRNRVLGSAGTQRFTVPVAHGSSYRRINETRIAPGMRWRRKLLCSLEQTYAKAPRFEAAWPLIEEMIRHPDDNLAGFIRHSLRSLTKYLGIASAFVESSTVYNNTWLRREERVLDICQRESATDYINPEGGRSLYEPKRFRERGLRLWFLAHEPRSYGQFGRRFVPFLSILDVIMLNNPKQIARLLASCRVFPADRTQLNPWAESSFSVSATTRNRPTIILPAIQPTTS